MILIKFFLSHALLYIFFFFIIHFLHKAIYSFFIFFISSISRAHYSQLSRLFIRLCLLLPFVSFKVTAIMASIVLVEVVAVGKVGGKRGGRACCQARALSVEK